MLGGGRFLGLGRYRGSGADDGRRGDRYAEDLSGASVHVFFPPLKTGLSVPLMAARISGE
jgi:hypothetical protein